MKDFESRVSRLVDREVKLRVSARLKEAVSALKGNGAHKRGTVFTGGKNISASPFYYGSAGTGKRFRVSRASKPAPAKNVNRQLAAKYMVAVRHLTVKQKAKVKAVRADGGVRKAIALAKSLSA